MKSQKTKILKNIYLIGLFLSSKTVVAETKYVLLEPSVFNKTGNVSMGFIEYAQAVFSVLLTASIVLAILMIVIGGFQYITSAAFSAKQEGKDKIKDALIGLTIILLSWLALYTINPKLINWNSIVAPSGTGGQ